MVTTSTSRRRRRKPKIIVAVHGIRTHAEWTTKLSNLLNIETDYQLWPLNYWPFDAIDLFLPLPFWKKRRDKLRDLLLEAASTGAEVSVIAHSFGTFLIINVLKANPHIKLEKLILCGSILRSEDLSLSIRRQVRDQVVNDCGIKDVWPCLAEMLSASYQATGVRGFGAPIVDRFHSTRHSDYFDEEFMLQYWIPLFKEIALEGQLRQGSLVRRSYPRAIQSLMWAASLRKKIAALFLIMMLTLLVLYVFGNRCWFSECNIRMNVVRSVSFAEAACYEGKRVYSNFIQDIIQFNRFISSYEARWYFENNNGRPIHNPPVVIDLGGSSTPIIPEDHAHAPRPFYSYSSSVSWLRGAKIQWDFRDVTDEPGGVGYAGRYQIDDLIFKIRLPRNMEIEKCDECANVIDGVKFENGVDNLERDIGRLCRVYDGGQQLSCSNLSVPPETKITYRFNIKGWGKCD